MAKSSAEMRPASPVGQELVAPELEPPVRSPGSIRAGRAEIGPFEVGTLPGGRHRGRRSGLGDGLQLYAAIPARPQLDPRGDFEAPDPADDREAFDARLALSPAISDRDRLDDTSRLSPSRLGAEGTQDAVMPGHRSRHALRVEDVTRGRLQVLGSAR